MLFKIVGLHCLVYTHNIECQLCRHESNAVREWYTARYSSSI